MQSIFAGMNPRSSTPDLFKDELYIKKAKLIIKAQGFICLQDYFASSNLNKDTLDRLTTRICEHGEFFQDLNTHTQKWVIKRSHHYKPETWVNRHRLLHDLILIVLTATLSLTIGWLLQRSDKQEVIQSIKQQNAAIRTLRDSLSNIQMRK